MPRDAADTRSALLEAGRHLFATEGVYATPLVNIVKAAGQRNSSALHYHFATDGVDARTGLLFTIIQINNASVEEIRQQMIDQLAEENRLDDLPALVRAAVIPLTHKFSDIAGREYLSIISQMVDHFNNWDAGGERMPGSAFLTFSSVEQALPKDLSPAVRRERVIRFLGMVVEAIGSHARYLTAAENQQVDSRRLETPSFIDNLIDMTVGALVAPQLSELSAPNQDQQ